MKRVTLVLLGSVFVIASSFIDRCSGEETQDQCQDALEWAKKSSEPLSDLSVILYRAISNGYDVEEGEDRPRHQKNIVFSPVSIAFALALLEAGADNDTRSQFRYVLVKRGSSDSDTTNIYQSLRRHLKPKPDGKVKLHIANGIYHRPEISLKDEYTEQTRPCFQSAIEACDFAANPDACRRRINEWVSENTAHNIPELFGAPGGFSGETMAVLASAIHFKASWKEPFSKEKMEMGEFYRFGRVDEEQKVQFLVQQHQYRYTQTSGVTIVGIPYKGNEFVMYFILPNKLDGLTEVETQLAGPELLFLFNRTRFEEVALKIPRFNVTTNVDLKPVLMSLGLNDMFGDGGDFSRMTDAKFNIDAAAHESHINVDESGTEAGGVQTFSMRSLSAPQPPIPVVANRPFLYAIVHQPTSAIIFAGKVLYIDE